MAATGRAAQVGNQPAAPLRYASLQLRMVAFILDSIVLASFFMLFFAGGAAYTLLPHGDNPPDSAFYVWLGFVVAFFMPFAPLYFAVLWSWRGQTVGMMAVHIKVAGRDGHPPSFGRALARALAWPLSLLPLGLGLVTVLFDRQNRALHDYLAGTIVVELP